MLLLTQSVVLSSDCPQNTKVRNILCHTMGKIENKFFIHPAWHIPNYIQHNILFYSNVNNVNIKLSVVCVSAEADSTKISVTEKVLYMLL